MLGGCAGARITWLAVAIILILLGHGVRARIIFLSGPLRNRSLACATVNLALGVQYGSSSTSGPVTALLYWFTGDPCDAHDVHNDLQVVGRAVLLTTLGICADEVVYDNFRTAGASAIIRSTGYYPGNDAYTQDASRRQVPIVNSIAYVEFFEADIAVESVCDADGDWVAVAPDYNIWTDTYQSWFYQIFLRWVPSTLFAMAAMSSFLYLYRHYRLVEHRSNRRPSRWKDAIGSARLPMTALAIQAVSCSVMTAVMALNGNSSATGLSSPVAHFFITHLSGCAWVVTLISGFMWHSVLRQQRRLSGPTFYLLPIPWYCIVVLLVPFTLDLATSICYASFVEKRYPEIMMANGALFALLELLAGGYFLYTALAVSYYLRRISANVQNQDPERHRFIQRMTLCAFGIAVATTAFLTASLIVALNDWFVRPTGWTVTWALYSLANSSKGLFHAQMLKPKDPGGPGAAPSCPPPPVVSRRIVLESDASAAVVKLSSSTL